MKILNKPVHLTFSQVFLMGLLVILLLQYLTGQAWSLIFLGIPLFKNPIMEFVPLLLLVLALFVFLYEFTPKQNKPLTVQSPHTNKFYIPRYAPEQVFNILMAVSVIWLLFLLIQIIIWTVFYHHAVMIVGIHG